jgi:hypothetical protein
VFLVLNMFSFHQTRRSVRMGVFTCLLIPFPVEHQRHAQKGVFLVFDMFSFYQTRRSVRMGVSMCLFIHFPVRIDYRPLPVVFSSQHDEEGYPVTYLSRT